MIQYKSKRILCFCYFLTSFSIIYAQDSAQLNRGAINIENQDRLDDDIFNAISKYQLIMVGEMHGTSEPARFVTSLANLLTERGGQVQIGLEIPSDRMKKFTLEPVDSNVRLSDFFSNKPLDGRPSVALSDLIRKTTKNGRIEVFFYDVNPGEIASLNRDSLMFSKVKRRIQLHPTWKTILLSGNIHNMLVPFDGSKKMGLYLKDDSDLNISNSMLSIRHEYSTGNIWSDDGDGFKIHALDHSDTIFARWVNLENYLFIYPKMRNGAYSAIYFTRKISPSKFVSKN